LRAEGVVPELVVVSPATRARQTWELTELDAKVTVDDRVYDSNLANLLTIVRETAESVASLAIVGHNPPIEVFTARHGGPGELSTSSVAVFEVDGSWADGEIRYFAVNACRG
jgi:phosphohistidine phosphatase